MHDYVQRVTPHFLALLISKLEENCPPKPRPMSKAGSKESIFQSGRNLQLNPQKPITSSSEVAKIQPDIKDLWSQPKYRPHKSIHPLDSAHLNPPKISLITGTAGRTTELKRLAYSIADQAISDVEWIIIDQNKDERARLIIQDYYGLVPIKHLRRAPNLSSALNTGAEIASAEILGFPDDDCWFDQKFASNIIDIFEANPDWDVLMCKVIDQAGRPAISNWETSSGPCNRFNAWVQIAATGLFIRRNIFNALGGFDPTLGLSEEISLASHDLDIVLRALEEGMSVHYVTQPSIFHPPMLKRNDKNHQRKAFSYAIGAGRLMRDHRMPLWWISVSLIIPVLRGSFAAIRGEPDSAWLSLMEAYGRLCGWLGKGGGRRSLLMSLWSYIID